MTRLHPVLKGLVLLACMSTCGSTGEAAEPEPVAIGSQLQLFLDEGAFERAQGVRLQLHHPTPREVVLKFDAPWEGPQSAYVTVLGDGERFRIYYRGGGDLSREYTCYAESRDGVHWTKPPLGLFEYGGSKQNNIIWTSARWKAYGESHNFAPFVDRNPATKQTERYKAVALDRHVDAQGERHRALTALASADGIVWKRLSEQPVMTEGSFDSQNTAFWDPRLGRYVCYLRIGRNGYRSIARSTSDDLLHWSRPEPLDFGDTPLEHFYTNAIVPYFREPSVYLGFPMRFVPQRKTIGAEPRAIDGVSDGVLISSRDGWHFTRTFMEAFLRPGPDPQNWGNAHGNNTPAWGLLATGPGEISLYWSEHYGDVPRIRRGTLRTDGFVSVRAPYQGGEIITRPVRFRGSKLVINYATSAVGRVQVELQRPEGEPIPGFALADCPEIYGDELARPVTWQGGSDLSGLAGLAVRLRFVLKDADLYSYRFQ